MQMTTSSSSRVRRGFTLTELLVVIVLLAIVGSVLTRTLAKQQQFYRGTSDVMELRTQLRQAAAAMAADVRQISGVGGDFAAGDMRDSSFDFRQTYGTGIICSIAGGRASIGLPATGRLSSGAQLTSWVSTPAVGDSILAFSQDSSKSSAFDRWTPYRITGFAANAGNLCGVNPFTSATDIAPSYTVSLGTALVDSVKVGSPVRFFRRVHYSLYQSSDGNWYLGYCSPSCGVSAISAIAGPFLPYAGGGTGGLKLAYIDSTGAATTTPANVRRIQVTLRGQTRSPVNISGYKTQTITDSVQFTVAIRNR